MGFHDGPGFIVIYGTGVVVKWCELEYNSSCDPVGMGVVFHTKPFPGLLGSENKSGSGGRLVEMLHGL